MDGVKVFIGIPSYSWSLSVPTVRSLIGDLFALANAGGKFTLYDEAGNTEIGAARMSIVSAFLKSDCTHLVFIDDDVCWQGGGLLRLIEAQEEFVGGVYPKRVDAPEWPVNRLENPETAADLIEVVSVPGGFMRLTRLAVERLSDAFGETMFDNIRDGQIRYAEDVSFCLRWRAIGGRVWALRNLPMGHVGNKLFQGVMPDVQDS